mgnify:FL=1
MKKSVIHNVPSLRSALRATALASLALAATLATGVTAALAESQAPFQNWHQGFQEDTAGWYDASTPGPVGWCGDISRVTRDDMAPDDPGPSAGKAYATVSFGLCNEFWGSLGVIGAPYAPGPDLKIALNAWPKAGYVTDLDVYLDPAWSGAYQGNFEFAGVPASTLIQYAARIFEKDYLVGDIHTGPHYFVDVEAVSGQEALSVGGYTVVEPAWYTFRFRFADSNGDVRVDFELLDRTGGVLTTIDNIAPTNLQGPFRTPFTDPVETANYTTGWVWFFDIGLGLALPIDEHRQRPGR